MSPSIVKRFAVGRIGKERVRAVWFGMDGDQDRCTTWEQAEEMHRSMVARVKKVGITMEVTRAVNTLKHWRDAYLRRVDRLVMLLKAARIAHNGKDKPLAVRRSGHVSIWEPEEDAGWLEYRNARYTLSEYPRLVMVLKKIGYI
jgi:hypothetical protein